MKKINYEKISVEELYKILDSNALGLDPENVDIKKNNYGLNIISNKKKRNKFLLFLDVFKNTSIIIELITVILLIVSYIFAKENLYLLILFSIITLVNIVFNYIYLLRIEEEIYNRYKLKESRIKVKRNSKMIEISNEEVVIGDIIILEEGDIIPADSKIIKAHDLKVNELKLKGKIKDKKDNDVVYANSLVVQGVAEAIVFATSKNTKFSKQSKHIALNRKDNSLSKNITKLNIYQNYLTMFLMIISLIFGILNNYNYLELINVLILVLIASNGESIFTTSYMIINKKIKDLRNKNIKVNNILSLDKMEGINTILFNTNDVIKCNELKLSKIYCDDDYLRDKELLLEDNKQLLNALMLCDNKPLENKAIHKYLTKLKTDTKLKGFDRTRTEDTSFYRTYVIHVNDVYIYQKGKLSELLNSCKYILYGGEKATLSEEKKKEIISINNELQSQDMTVEVYTYKLQNSMDLDKNDNYVFLGLAGFTKVNVPNIENSINKLSSYKLVVLNDDNLKETSKLASSCKLCNTDLIADCNKEYNLSSNVFANINDKEIKKILKHYDLKTTMFIDYDNDNGINVSTKQKDIVIEKLDLKTIYNLLKETKRLSKIINKNILSNIIIDIFKIIFVLYGIITNTNMMIYVITFIILKYVFALIIGRNKK